jgi:uncharacterized protein YbjQ (UPF0145 family)
MVVSTRSAPAARARPIQQVEVEQCSMVVLVVPIIPDPRAAFDRLLEQAEKAGGNAVVDVQTRPGDVMAAVPLFTRVCYKLEGTAAQL